jgi:hypothetical protein
MPASDHAERMFLAVNVACYASVYPLKNMGFVMKIKPADVYRCIHWE